MQLTSVAGKRRFRRRTKSFPRRAKLSPATVRPLSRGRWRHGGAWPACGRRREMILPRTRRALGAVLACILAFAVPAHAAGMEWRTAGPDWLGKALGLISGLWRGDTKPVRPVLSPEKYGPGSDPDGSPQGGV